MINVGGYRSTPKTAELVLEVVRSDRLSQGPMVKQFEIEVAREHGCNYGIFVNSGTSALHIALQALKIDGKWDDWDEVIVPAVTFVATYNIILHNRLTPILVDVDLDDYGMCLDSLRDAISHKTRAIIPVHLFGQPCRIKEITNLAEHFHLKVVEDSCECMFAQYEGKPVGSYGNLGCFSTYMAHILNTGVGGFVTTNDEHLYKLCRSLANHGRDISYITIDDKVRNISSRFKFDHIGHSFRGTELEAAVGLAELETIHQQIETRRKNAAKLTEYLLGYPLVLPKVMPNRTHSFMMYPIMYPERDLLTQFLELNGIETRPLVSITNQPCYRIDERAYPNAMACNRNGFYIGCHPYISQAELVYMKEIFQRYFQENR